MDEIKLNYHNGILTSLCSSQFCAHYCLFRNPACFLLICTKLQASFLPSYTDTCQGYQAGFLSIAYALLLNSFMAGHKVVKKVNYCFFSCINYSSP